MLGVVILTKLFASLDFPGWHILPGAIDLLPQPLVIVIIVVVSTLLFLYRKRGKRKSERSKGDS